MSAAPMVARTKSHLYDHHHRLIQKGVQHE